MKRLVLIFSIIGILASTAPSQEPVRIKFRRGATSAVVTGKLFDQKYHSTFLIKVTDGQILSTSPIGRAHPITILIKQPDGTPYEADMDLSCHARHEIAPTVAGDYQIIVTECNKADAWRGTFKFKVTVR